MDKSKKLPPFVKGLLIYIAVFILISAVALGIFYGFINAYEKSRPVNGVKAYLEDIRTNGLTEACIAALPELDTRVMSLEENTAVLENIMAEATYSKRSSMSTAEAEAYAIKYDGEILGIVYIQQCGKSSFGFTNWEVTGEEYDFSPVINTFSIAIPADYTVSLAGKDLDSSFVTDKKVAYELLSSCYKDFSDLPYLVRYETGAYLGQLKHKVLDSKGSEVSAENQNEVYYMGGCSDELTARLDEFSREFVRRYSLFGANVDGLIYNNYAYLKEMVVPKGELHTRQSSAFDTLVFANTKSCELLDCTLNSCADLGNGLLFADVSYSNEIRGLADPVVTESNTRLIIQMDEDGDLLVDGMYNY